MKFIDNFIEIVADYILHSYIVIHLFKYFIIISWNILNRNILYEFKLIVMKKNNRKRQSTITRWVSLLADHVKLMCNGNKRL